MARFDEFRESLLEAWRELELTISYLGDDGFEDEEDYGEYLYGKIHDALIDADSELNNAQQDIHSNVGITCDRKRLETCLDELDSLADCIWENVQEYDIYDTHRNCDYIRSIRSLQYDIDQILHDAR